jgi:hypothetical protein
MLNGVKHLLLFASSEKQILRSAQEESLLFVAGGAS